MSTLENIKHFRFTLFVILTSITIVHAQDDQSGYISIDCGLTESSGNYTERTTGIKYIPDEPFVNSGESRLVPLENRFGYQKQCETLRVFPEGIRNCYTVNVTREIPYIIRAGFFYGNYDNKSYPPSFFIHLGSNYWDTIVFYIDVPITREIIHVPLDDHVSVCLVNNGTGAPTIYALELRPLVNKTYPTQSGSLRLYTRTDLGSITNRSYAYPYDAFDRDWSYWELNNYKPNWTAISTPLHVNSGSSYKPPSVVMKTAVTPTDPKEPLIYSWTDYEVNDIQYVYLHFAEIKKLKPNQSRSFDIYVDGELYPKPVVPDYLNVTTIAFTTSSSPSENIVARYNFTLVQRKTSTLPPILNAVEIYNLLDLSQSETNTGDVEAISKIKSTYKVKRNWDGDPCAPIKYLWTGLTCSYDGSDPPRITELNLSSSGLIGELTSSISKLPMLEVLDLSNNGLTGSVPEFLVDLQHLSVIKLDNNSFIGSIPATLIERSKNGSLDLSIINFDSGSTKAGTNTSPCSSSPCPKKKKSALAKIIAVVAVLFIVFCAVVTFLIAYRKEKIRSGTKKTKDPVSHNGLFEAKNRQFNNSEVVNMTKDFERVLGHGGFGTVYHGFIGNTQVAVKKLSVSSTQGYQQFQAEVRLLVTVHHRNLTSLVGYCIEGNDMALIYEYMENGDLHSHLFNESNTNVLSWDKRLRILVESAQGLEYLHSGCKPPIVHRDIKATNILLTENFQAKLADFGLSKSFSADGDSHVSTIVAGTPGYLDPEYSSTNWLTEKSDVYSFGVVILEMVTGRSAILKRGNERSHISQWVSSMLSNGDIKTIIDQRLKGSFETNSAWKAVEIAMICLCPSSAARPDMGQVVTELKECLAVELAGKTLTESPDSNNIIVLQSPININIDVGPLLR